MEAASAVASSKTRYSSGLSPAVPVAESRSPASARLERPVLSMQPAAAIPGEEAAGGYRLQAAMGRSGSQGEGRLGWRGALTPWVCPVRSTTGRAAWSSARSGGASHRVMRERREAALDRLRPGRGGLGTLSDRGGRGGLAAGRRGEQTAYRGRAVGRAVTDVNSRSGSARQWALDGFPFPRSQMTATEALLDAIAARWTIAPARRCPFRHGAGGARTDPGPKFDWRRLALGGRAIWPEPCAAAPAGPVGSRGGGGDRIPPAPGRRLGRGARRLRRRFRPGAWAGSIPRTRSSPRPLRRRIPALTRARFLPPKAGRRADGRTAAARATGAREKSGPGRNGGG